MKLELTDRQKEIVKRLRANDGDANKKSFDNLEDGLQSNEDIDAICGVINSEFMMEGIHANFEPNEYGIELEAILDLVNHSRIKPC